MLKFISKAPLALVDDEFDYIKLINHLNIYIDGIVGEPFSFKSTKQSYNEVTRKIVPIGDHVRTDQQLQNLFTNWVEKRLPEFVRYLGNEVKNESFQFRNQENFRLAIRIRVLLDQKGYSLAPHKDSEDTVFAFLLQLHPKNPTTSAFLRDKQVFKVNTNGHPMEDEEDHRRFFQSFFEKIYKEVPNYQIAENAFGGKSKFISWNDDGTVWLTEKKSDVVFANKYDTLPLMVNYGQLLALHNPLSDFAFSSSYTKYIQQNTAHGFFPAQFEQRPVLLMDLLASYSKDEIQDYMRSKNDSNEYYFYFKKETSDKIMKAANFF